MRSRLGILLALVAATAGVSPAAAAENPKQVGRTAALCSGEVEETADPGFWLITPGEITISGVGTMTCVGTVDGKRLTGQPGPMAYRGSYDGRMAGMSAPLVGDTCLAGSGSGTWEATLPTADGSALAYGGAFDFEYVFTFSVLHGALGTLPARNGLGVLPQPREMVPRRGLREETFPRCCGEGRRGPALIGSAVEPGGRPAPYWVAALGQGIPQETKAAISLRQPMSGRGRLKARAPTRRPPPAVEGDEAALLDRTRPRPPGHPCKPFANQLRRTGSDQAVPRGICAGQNRSSAA